MPDFPSLSHVAVTVTDLDRSTRWYTALFGFEPVLDEDEQAGGFHHTVYALPSGQVLDCTPTPPRRRESSMSVERDWTMSRSRAADAVSCSSGRAAWTSWVFLTRGSKMPQLRFRRLLPRPRRHRPRVLRTTWW